MATMFNDWLVRRMRSNAKKDYIEFVDPVVAQICATNWGDGVGITYAQAARVTNLGGAFQNNTSIVSFDELQYFTGITTFNYYGNTATGTFSGCTNLVSVVLPSSARTLYSTFKGCTKLQSVGSLANITTLTHSPFMDCTSLAIDVYMPNLTSISDHAFIRSGVTSVTSLGSITAMSGGTYNDQGIFRDCTSLTSVVLPSTLTSLGASTFRGCSALASLTVSTSARFSIGAYAFYYCSSLSSFPFVCATSIGERAFQDSAITTVDAPNITSLSQYAFYECTSLTSIVSLGTVTSLPSQMAAYSSILASINIPETVTRIYNGACFRANPLLRVVIPRSVTRIDAEAFTTRNNPNLDKYYTVLNPTPPTLGNNVFSNYIGAYQNGLVTIYVPWSIDHSVLAAYKTASKWSDFASKTYELDPVPAEYRRLTGIVFDGNVWYDTGLPLLGSDTVKISFSATKACNVFGCYTSTDAQDNYSLYVSTTSSAKYTRYNGGTYSSYIAANTRYDVTITPTGTDGMRTDSTWTEKTFTCPTNMLIGSTSVGATSAKFTGTMYGDIEIVGRALFIPVERISDGEIGYYEPVSGAFLTNQGTGTPTALGYA